MSLIQLLARHCQLCKSYRAIYMEGNHCQHEHQSDRRQLLAWEHVALMPSHNQRPKPLPLMQLISKDMLHTGMHRAGLTESHSDVIC